MGKRRCQSIERMTGNKKGETLVETIVSFAIFLIALAAVTLLIRSATAMNVKASEKSSKIEAAAVIVENDSGEEQQKGSMKFNFDDKSVDINISIKDADPFTYFSYGGED